MLRKVGIEGAGRGEGLVEGELGEAVGELVCDGCAVGKGGSYG